MRSPEEIHSMIEFLQARGEHHSDISILKWVLNKDVSESERQHNAEISALKESMHGQANTIAHIQRRNGELETEVRRLQALVVKGATVVRIPQ